MNLHFLELDVDVSIYEQLLIEEYLLRNDQRNFCIFNKGSSPTIVMGISGKVDELVNIQKAKSQNIPIVKRFSGGGTVVVDHNTLFVTFIFQKSTFSFPAYPEKIMKWTEEVYQSVFPNNFLLKENDYVFDQFKFGGNAQYIKKERWLHHTSFLWDYENDKMSLLLHPRKTPNYRDGRAHENFLCKLKDFIPSQEDFLKNLKVSLSKNFTLIEIHKEDLELSESMRVSTVLI